MTKQRSAPASPYDEAFYAGKDDGSYRSAMVVLPIVFAMVGKGSVVDIGCGTGTWLQAAAHLGIETYHGYDGTRVRQLRIPKERFTAADLSEPLPSFTCYDLAICCEVAEHLPASLAETLIATLTSLSQVVLFSAAIPGQGGVHHVNEQWPAYWQARFRARQYSAYDVIRPRIWNDERVEWWYRQNTVLYIADEAAARFQLPSPTSDVLPLVHPALYQSQQKKKLLRNAVRKTKRALQRITRRQL